MHSSISRSYIVPAIFLNPVILLMGVNTLLSRVLPPVTVSTAIQPPPYSTFGPSAEHPHLDIHHSEGLCWGYTFFIVCAQLMAFGRVNERREEDEENLRVQRYRLALKSAMIKNGKMKSRKTHLEVLRKVGKEEIMASDHEECHSCGESDLESHQTRGSDDSYITTDTESVL